MPSATFERTLDTSSTADECWRLLTDVDRVAGWVTVVRDVRELEHLQSYEAVLSDQFGPFSLNADLDVRVVELEEGERIRFRAKGSDRQVGASIDVDAQLELVSDGPQTRIVVSGKYSVVGTVATMGAGTIRKKADTVIEEFFGAAARELA